MKPSRAGLLLVPLLSGCLRYGQPAGPPRGTYAERLSLHARLLRMEDRRVFEPVLVGRAASSPDRFVRARAALAAGRAKDPAAGPHLLVLLRDPEPEVRRAAAFAAGIGGDARLVHHLVATLRDTDAETAAAAAEALGRLGGEEATAALLAELSREGAARPQAARALFRTPDAARVARLAALADAPDAALRRAVFFALARKPLPEALSVIRKGLSDADTRVQALCARAAGVLKDRESLPALAGLASSPDGSVSIQALAALRALGQRGEVPSEACAAARGRLADANAGAATTALGALSGCRDPESERALRAALAGGGPRGEEALGALAAHAADAAALVEAAASAPSLELRLGAAAALARIPDGDSDRVARLLLRDPVARIRAAAVEGLREKAPLELLLLALRDADPAVRESALGKAAARHDEAPDLAAAWDRAYAAQFEAKEPDYTVGALEAAAELPAGGAALLRAKASDRDAVVRGTARRLLIAKHGAKREEFDEIPVAVRYGLADYERMARQANESALAMEVATSRGSFTVALDAEAAPMTVDTFRELASRRYFDGTVIHRVVPDFVVQAGDPRGDGTGGPGFTIRDELNPLPYARGSVGMALAGADTGGSQWFVTLSPQPHLEGAYTVFGKVVLGDEVLDRIEKDDRLVSVRVTSSRREPPPGFTR